MRHRQLAYLSDSAAKHNSIAHRRRILYFANIHLAKGVGAEAIEGTAGVPNYKSFWCTWSPEINQQRRGRRTKDTQQPRNKLGISLQGGQRVGEWGDPCAPRCEFHMLCS